jgi:uncharacterized protein YqjF (DUF2071 family)
MTQTWDDLLFIHWPIDPNHLRPLLPAAVELDTFEGRAWLGIIPFRLGHIRVRGLPTLPGLSHFPEVNVRTYVRLHNKPGVWFFSLDANHPILSAVARRWFSLPYRNSHVTMRCDGEWIDYTSTMSQVGKAPVEFRARYRPTGPVVRASPGSIAHWLTERYCLYTTDRRGRLLRAEIHHPRWALQDAEVSIAGNTLALASGIRIPDTAPLAHYSKSITSLIWSPQLLEVSGEVWDCARPPWNGRVLGPALSSG